MKVLGILILIFGIFDLLDSYIGLDLWGDLLSLHLPVFLDTFGPLVEIALGAGVLILNEERNSY